MKKIGLVGGISWTSTLDYYRYINEGVNRRLGGLNFAECMIHSINFQDFQRYTSTYDWDGVDELIGSAAESLAKAGADLIMLGANTAHIVAERVQERVGLPLVHIVDATSAVIKEKGLKRVGLLGTTYTMELDFYKDRLKANGIEPIVPAEQADRDYIEQSLRHELGRGILKDETRLSYLGIIADLVARGAEGIILGCTEIPMLVKQEQVDVPVFDTTRIHAEAAVELAVRGFERVLV